MLVVSRHPLQFTRPGRQACRVAARRHGGLRKVACRRARCTRHRVVAQLQQRVDDPRHGPARQRRALPGRHRRRQPRPSARVDAGLQPVQRIQRPPTAGGQQRQRVGFVGHALATQPGHCDVGRRCIQTQLLASAAHGGQEQRRVGRSQQQPRARRRFFQCLQQCVRCLRVECFGRMQQQHLAAATRAGARAALDQQTYVVDADLAAGLALAVGLVVGQGPVEFSAQGLGQQHGQVRVHAGLHQPAAAAAAAGPRGATRGVAGLAQPGLGQREGKGAGADAGGAMHQQRMAARCRQRGGQRRPQPGQRQAAVFADDEVQSHIKPTSDPIRPMHDH